ncbi:hypothetical protein PUNSTDRAFT_59428 [Punctularia strigosozonata HHB-11173 SS5]|uniref:uncharacterized protein n=1 Tax=Punctularia strigosozonata (strain HHB-11173) TaxID=741275 RepID=UPI00044165BD|nr:uncharacterized protein PUNSTDRAFT_59428 [Punctularia strigosozonata HHB-11173 SS5]EIN13827.1 hypothetical protein PUNSTDRAFT_59428 [Punctularia strigosozonata HHB-11173 SS5]
MLLHAELFDILQIYYALLPSNYLPASVNVSFTCLQNFLLDHILWSKHASSYPPSKMYQASFWKWSVSVLENMLHENINTTADDEIDEHIYLKYSEILLSNKTSTTFAKGPPEPCFVSYFYRSVGQDVDSQDHNPSYVNLDTLRIVTILESQSMIEAGTTGLRTWPASIALARYLLGNPELVHAQRVLELGSGVGFLGCIVGSIQTSRSITNVEKQCSLCLTDVNDTVLERCQTNVQLPCNNLQSHPELTCRKFDWSDTLAGDFKEWATSFHNVTQSTDIVIGADLVYDPSLIDPLLATLKIALENQQRISSKGALIALTLRNRSTMAEFCASAGKLLPE